MRGLITAIIISLCSGCSLGIGNNPEKDFDSETSALTPSDGMPVIVPPMQYLVTRVSTFDSAMESVAQKLSVVPSGTTRGLRDLNRSSLPLTGAASEISTGAWMTVSVLAGSVCNDLIVKERATMPESRVFFREIRFGQNNNLSTVIGGQRVFDSMTNRLGLALWGRKPSSAETQMISASLSDATLPVDQTLNATNTEAALLFTCAGMAASLSTHEK